MKFDPSNTIIYTSLIGQNEGLNIQPYINKSAFRHVCITDNENIKSDEWEIIYIKPLLSTDPQRSQRNFKIRPHLIFPDYKYSLYLDNTILFKCKVEEFLNYINSIFNIKANDPFFILPYHSYRENLISEFIACFQAKLDYDYKFYEQLSDYIRLDSEALKLKPYWCGILVRNHMHKNVIHMSEIWFANVLKYSKRDQLSIIHSGLQSGLKINAFEIDIFSSKFHQWPVAKIKRKFRETKNNFLELDSEFFEHVVTLLALKKNEDKIDFNKIKKTDYFKNSFHKFTKLEELLKNEKKLVKDLKTEVRELSTIKKSKTWRILLIIRKFITRITKFQKKLFGIEIFK